MSSLDSEQSDQTKLAEVPATDGQAPDSFWNGDPATLPDEVQPVYKNLQADYTRKSQEIANQRREAEQATAFYNAIQSQDPQALRQIADVYGQETVLDTFGYALDNDDPQEYSDPIDALRKELDELKGNVTKGEQKAQEEALLVQIESDIAQQFKGVDLSEKEQEIVTAHALTAGYVTADGFPDVKKAYADFEEVLSEQQKKWASGKRAPRQPVQGTTGSDKVDFGNEDERRALIASMLDANSE